MKIERIEKRVFEEGPSPEKSPEVKMQEEQLVEFIEELIQTEEQKIGEGRTAEVFYPAYNDDLCYKVIRRLESFGEDVPLKYRRPGRGNPAVRYNRLIDEGEFLVALQNSHNTVGVPMPSLALTIDCSEEGEKYWVKERIEALLMKRLKGCYTIREILEKNLPLPEDFDIERCFHSIREFTQKMHAKGIHHRDLHDGNIMIDLGSGRPWVIDFGVSIHSDADGAYRDQETDGSETVYTSDGDNVAKAERLLRQYLTRTRT